MMETSRVIFRVLFYFVVHFNLIAGGQRYHNDKQKIINCSELCLSYCKSLKQPNDSHVTNSSGKEESGEDEPYHEGEDAPIEITLRPLTLIKDNLFGRPIRPVNFIGFEDFGPNGKPTKYRRRHKNY